MKLSSNFHIYRFFFSSVCFFHVKSSNIDANSECWYVHICYAFNFWIVLKKCAIEKSQKIEMNDWKQLHPYDPYKMREEEWEWENEQKKLSLIRIHVFKMLYALWNILQKNFFFYFSNKNKRNRDKCVTSIHAYLFSLKGRILLTQHHSRIHSTNVCVCVRFNF